MRRAGDAGVVHFVETLHGLVAVVLPALQQVMHGHGAAVVVDVVAALAVGEDLDALDKAGGVGRGWGQRVGAVRVPDAEGDLDGLGVDEGRAAGQRDAADPRGCGGERTQRAEKSTARHAAPSRSWCCLFSACSPGSASASWAPAVTTSMLVYIHAC